MTLKTWLKFVEIQSLVASVLPLVLGNLYAAITYQHMNAVLAIVFVIVAFALQMAVNVWNNLQDFKSATSEEWKNGVNNIVGSGGITPRQGWTTLIALVLIVAVGGLWLVSQTGIPLLVMGLIGFVVAYWYAGTPLPLSRTPFGELASGLTMGYLIFLSATYVNVAPTFTTELVLHAIVASAISWFAIGDIMLANNIGDYEEDLAENRHTLVWYLGKERAVKVFGWIYLAGYIVLILAVILRILPWPALITLVSFPIVMKNTKAFQANPIKPHFPQAIKNAVVISLTLAIGLVVALFI
ncbi:prenyltransferase [Weissella confusa]|uniref:prenyltransferase n=1 Tax=Weissella confusa TaxID=1583 RepID=UPI0018F24429|nr:prenyltransferase [Weissella confusa]MBJ7682117.1 prenyltransferase [Weissella confusa]MBJ7684304.1 prenyltransferase [Weissella confusa]MBJ7702722.1 prenyltransferase [Weissella confusa]